MRVMFYIIGLVMGVAFGWAWAHHEVSTECQRQGNFYVGKTVYRCEVKNE